MFSSRFDCLAEIEAFRAGFNPSAVRSVFNVRLVAVPTPACRQAAPDRLVRVAAVAIDEADIRREMERRLAARRISLTV
jgi:hypothetical protein